MPRDDRTYITVHDGMPEHPKIDPLSDAAFRLLVSSWCWCSRNQTDGYMPIATWAKRGTAKARAELMTAEMAEPASGDRIHLHDYLEHQRSAAEIAALKEKRRAAGSKGGKAKANGLASAIASAKQKPKQTASKVVADTEPSFQEGKRSNSPNDVGSRNAPVGSIARIVKLYVESGNAAGMPAPTESQDRIERSARSLVEQGFPLEQIEDAARNAAVGGWTDLAQQLQRDAARAKPSSALVSTADARFLAGAQLAEQLERKAIG